MLKWNYETRKIYIVEDDNTIVSLLKQHLSKVYDVYSVNNFRAIKQEIEEITPDLILMDITLPYFNGFYWTTEIRKTMTLPIIFISSSDDEMDTVMALNMGGDDFISKPFSLAILDAKISAFCAELINSLLTVINSMNFRYPVKEFYQMGVSKLIFLRLKTKSLAFYLNTKIKWCQRKSC